jgi:hypothetical protein
MTLTIIPLDLASLPLSRAAALVQARLFLGEMSLMSRQGVSVLFRFLFDSTGIMGKGKRGDWGEGEGFTQILAGVIP